MLSSLIARSCFIDYLVRLHGAGLFLGAMLPVDRADK